jgi:hypothetical protein
MTTETRWRLAMIALLTAAALVAVLAAVAAL